MRERFSFLPGRKAEVREGRSYTQEDLSNLVFWSFFVSQGSESLQRKSFDLFFIQHPKAVQPALEWLKQVGFSSGRLNVRQNRVANELVQRCLAYRDGPAHISAKPIDFGDFSQPDEYETVEGALSDLFNAASSARKNRNKEQRLLSEFVKGVVEKEIDMLKRLGNSRLDPELRKKRGHSMLFKYGLSGNAETSAKFLPGEYQELWRTAGKYVLEKNTKLPSELRVSILQLRMAYEEATGEKIALDLGIPEENVRAIERNVDRLKQFEYFE